MLPFTHPRVITNQIACNQFWLPLTNMVCKKKRKTLPRNILEISQKKEHFTILEWMWVYKWWQKWHYGELTL